MKGVFDVKKSCEAQKALIEKNNYPFFPPPGGVCSSCGKNIYQGIINIGGHTRGIDIESASKSLVTSCPHCNRSYCD